MALEINLNILYVLQLSSSNRILTFVMMTVSAFKLLAGTPREPLGINLPLFSTILPSKSCCFCPVGLSLLIHFQQVLWVLKLLLSPGRIMVN
jgi:hypothetical protein